MMDVGTKASAVAYMNAKAFDRKPNDRNGRGHFSWLFVAFAEEV